MSVHGSAYSDVRGLLAEATRRFPPPARKRHRLTLGARGALRLTLLTGEKPSHHDLSEEDLAKAPVALLNEIQARVPSLAALASSGVLSEEGEDAHGRFVVLTLGAVVQRFRFIAPGKFKMGSPSSEAGRWDDEGPQHEVELTNGYWMADTPVTQALWTAVMGDNPSRFKGAERPVEQVSWEDCKRFITRLNGLVPGLDARLPTEAEWENACRGGTTGATWVGELDLDRHQSRAPVLDAIAVYYGNSPDGSQPVKTKGANPLGLYDMLGNVYEWCEDWFGAYDRATVTDPRGPKVGSNRVLRGGCWGSLARIVRAAYRLASDPGYRAGNLGFRLARGHQV